MLKRLISLCLIVALLAGCATTTRQINFDSRPAGATVQLLGSTCTTPCVMHMASNKAELADISLGAGEKKVVRIEARPGMFAQVGSSVSSAGATTLKYIAVPLLAVGIFGLVLISGNETDSFDNRNYEVGRDGFYITLGALASGAVLAYVAYNMEQVSSDLKRDQDVYVVFDVPAETSGSNNKPSLTLDEFLGGKLFPSQ